jgi:signal transduction histidine kinase
MTSLRVRLSLTLGSAFVVIWLTAGIWMLCDLRDQMMESLDQRLTASARMVGGMLAQLPMPGQAGDTPLSAEKLGIVSSMACQVNSLRGELLARNHSSPEQSLSGEDAGFSDRLIDGEHWRSYTLVVGDLRITTADRQAERDQLRNSVLLAASLPVLAALLGSLGLLWLGIGKGLAPLHRMRDSLKRRRADSVEPLHVAGLPSELQPLLDTQNQLFQRIAQTLERERRLTGDAAHELRSPLTAIKTHLQVARMTEGEARDRSLAHAEEGADRLHHTLEQLLLLARVEGSLSFDDGVQCTAEDAARLAIHDTCQDEAGIALHVAQPLSTQMLEIPSVLAIAALRNLLENALRHTPAQTAVELSLSTASGQACFSVRDHGPGIPEQHLQHLTRRFWRQGQGVGSGLGLAIVQAIVQRCDGSLTFDSQPDGLRVTLCLPLRKQP